jgi:hypothetical protein
LLQIGLISFPVTAGWFKVTRLGPTDWSIILGLSVATILINEMVKLVVRFFGRRRRPG